MKIYLLNYSTEDFNKDYGYFSTREKDLSGQYLSHIAFADIDKNFKEVLHISDKSVLELGALGCYAEHGIFP